MDVSGFFVYPDDDAQGREGEMVFLADSSEDDWSRLLAHATDCRFRAGDVVIREGDAQRALYIVAEGTLEVVAGDVKSPNKKPRQLATIEAGSVFGEQAFLDGKPRSATVRAVTDCRLFQLRVEAFEALAAREPKLARDVLFDLGRIVSIRLREASAFISSWVG